MKLSSRKIGLHFRLKDSYSNLLQEIQTSGADIAQFLLIPDKKTRHLRPPSEDLETFLENKTKTGDIYIHSSFKINIATGIKEQKDISKYVLQKELEIAKKLKASYMVLHPGHATGHKDREMGIATVLKNINEVFKNETEVKVLIENEAHAKKAICGNLEDFSKIREKSDNVGFCLDLAHAFVYGYNLRKTEEFIKTLDQTMGIDNIKLIHLNDSFEKLGSRQDSHAPPGKGEIGKDILNKIVNHKKLKHIPMIIELPATEYKNYKTILDEVKTW